MDFKNIGYFVTTRDSYDFTELRYQKIDIVLTDGSETSRQILDVFGGAVPSLEL